MILALFFSEHKDGIVISMVVGGEVLILKSLEESSGLVIAEMPIHVSLFFMFSICSDDILFPFYSKKIMLWC